MKKATLIVAGRWALKWRLKALRVSCRRTCHSTWLTRARKWLALIKRSKTFLKGSNRLIPSTSKPASCLTSKFRVLREQTKKCALPTVPSLQKRTGFPQHQRKLYHNSNWSTPANGSKKFQILRAKMSKPKNSILIKPSTTTCQTMKPTWTQMKPSRRSVKLPARLTA